MSSKFHKKKKYMAMIGIVIICLTAFVVLCNYNVNKRFPNVSQVEAYSAEHPANVNGLLVTPRGMDIYTVDEFCNQYPDNSEYTYLKEETYESKREYLRVLVFEVSYKNLSDEVLLYYSSNYDVEAMPSGLHNGLRSLNSADRCRIEPGEEQVIQLHTTVGNSLVKKEWLNKMDSNEFHLVFQQYPIKKMLVFN